ncbi:MAG TPA: IclR family transcriptional regulator [Friedmanniella sp.]
MAAAPRVEQTGDQDSRRGGAAAGPGVTAPSPAAYRAGLVLEVLARRSEPMPLTTLATELGLAKSSALNLLVSLEASGMVRRTAAGWVLGFKVLELSRAALTSTEVVAEFQRATAASRELVGETVVLAVLDGTDVVYVARHDGQQPVRYVNEIGTRNPAAVTALGRAMLASLSDEELERRLGDGTEPLPVRTSRSLRNVDQLRLDLDAVRERGYAIDDEQGVPGIRCFSVPVGSPGTPTAVSVSFVADRLTPELETSVVAGLTRLAARLRRAEPS